MAHNKKFMLVGPQYVSYYTKLYPLFCNKTLNFGNTTLRHFIKPNGEKKDMCTNFWITNLPILPKSPIKFTKTYNPMDYPQLDGCKAIFIKALKDIPKDYHGWMAVPGTIFSKDMSMFKIGPIIFSPYVNGTPKFRRIAVRFKH